MNLLIDTLDISKSSPIHLVVAEFNLTKSNACTLQISNQQSLLDGNQLRALIP